MQRCCSQEGYILEVCTAGFLPVYVAKRTAREGVAYKLALKQAVSLLLFYGRVSKYIQKVIRRMIKKTIKAAFVASLPVLMGYVSMGIAFGVLLVTQVKEANGWWAFLMSFFTISGSMQFAAVELLKNSVVFSLFTVALLTILINIRYMVYGLPFIELFKKYPWYLKWYLIWGLTDETYALMVQDSRRGFAKRIYLLGVAFFNHMYWIIGSVTGAIAGKYIPFNTKGIDFAMAALFLVILTDQCRKKDARISALIGGGVTAIMLMIFVIFAPMHANKMLLPAMLVIIAILVALRSKLEPKELS